MIVFLAGGVSGNLKPAWSNVAARSDRSLEALKDELTKERYITKDTSTSDADLIASYRPYILESFYYVDKDTELLLPFFGDFMLDSGAFTFMEGNGGKVCWEEYLERYADFIVRNNVQKFYELDIDSVVGYDKVLDLRRRLESLTGRQSIPVWHSNRGIREFYRMCDEYDYVALGGIVGNEWDKKAEHMLPAFIYEAHKRGAKIHGLGFTKLKLLEHYHFDSVDSTAWTAGNRFGFVYHFDGRTMQKTNCPKGMRLADSRKVAFKNYIEWIKFQRYAESNL